MVVFHTMKDKCIHLCPTQTPVFFTDSYLNGKQGSVSEKDITFTGGTAVICIVLVSGIFLQDAVCQTLGLNFSSLTETTVLQALVYTPTLSITGLLTAELGTREGACSSRLQMPFLKRYTTVEMGVEFNTSYFSIDSAISSLLVYLPFALSVHGNCSVKSFWCIPGEKELLSVAVLSLVRKLRHIAHATCHQLPNLWGASSS